MMQMLIHHPAACLIAFLSLVALMFVANQLGLIAWIAWLDHREEDHREEDHREEDRREEDRREDRRHGESTGEYWRVHK